MTTGSNSRRSAAVVLRGAEITCLLEILRNPKVYKCLSGQQRRRITELIQLLESIRNENANSKAEVSDNQVAQILRSTLFCIPAVYKVLASFLNSDE